MKNFSTWLLVMFMGLFWMFRIGVALMTQAGKDFGGVVAFNETLEIILLFVVILCMVLIVKRKLVGGLIYLLAYGMYFGSNLMQNVTSMMQGNTLAAGDYLTAFVSLIGIIIPLAVVIDLLADKNRKAHPKDKKTDWFYANEQFDRELDERADKNNYRTM